MPIYEYKCNTCGHIFEKFQSMSDEPIKKCPVCNGTVKRLIGGGVGLIFKGSGFYITDYKKKGNDSKKEKSAESNDTKNKSKNKKEQKGKED